MTNAAIGKARRSGYFLALAITIVYLVLATPFVVDGDNSEFASLAGVNGAAHPSGYPLYLLWLRATAWLPGSSVAHSASIATAILGALGVFVLHAACRAWGARPIAATLVAGLYATGPVIVGIATSAEVFALNQLVVATILLLAARNGPLKGSRRAILLGLVAGLGLSDHTTCALLAPIGILGVVRGLRETTSKKPIVIAMTVGALAIGLLPYLYLLAPPHENLGWGQPQSLGDLVHHFLRLDYGGPGAFARTGTVDVGANLAELARTLGRTWWWVPMIGGLAWFGVRAAKPNKTEIGETRVAWILLAACFLVAGPILAARFNVPPIGLGAYVARRFHLLPVLLLAPAIAGAFDKIGGRFAARVKVPALGAWIVTGLVLVASAAIALPRVAAVHSPATQTSIENLLKSLPPNAVVIHGQDLLLFGGDYVQVREGIRPDVVLVSWATIKTDWYLERMRARGIVLEDGAGNASTRVAEAALAAGHPVFIDNTQSSIVRELPTYPYATLFRVLPRGTKPPSIETVFLENKKLYEQFALDYAFPGSDDDFATDAHERYAETWRIIAKALAHNHRDEAAAEAAAIAQQIGPQP